ncbi:MAG: flagellar biosynthetic protein FliR [FCB group bacterium]|jgi:flagellar biosynthetic protein FliR
MLDSGTIYILTGKFIIGILIFVRVLGFTASSPFLRSPNIPVQLKVFLSAIIAMSMTTVFWKDQPVIDLHLWNLVFLVFKEFFVGVAIGFAANTVFWGARTAGALVDYDMGFYTAALFSQEEDAPTLDGELKYMIAIVLFFYINGHHILFESLYASVRAVPLTTFAITDSSIGFLIKMATSVLVIGIKLAAPIIVAIFLTNLALALLARIAPQTNIFILSFQFKIGVGLLILLISVPLMVMVTKYLLQSMNDETMRFLMTLNPARVK